MYIPSKYCQYSHRCYALLGVLLTLVYGLPPALAAEGHDGPLSNSWLRPDQIVAATPWSGHLPLHYGKSNNSAAFDAEAGKSGRGYRWEGPPAESQDWRGIKWDTFYFVAYQFVAIGILYILPESISGWTQEDKEEYSFSKWVDNVKHPVWDEDEWYVNYILHPYWGAAYYVRARERGFEREHSFWYSFLLSTMYEFGLEALFEPVSYQDLVVTPVAGALLGEFVFTPIRERIRAKSGQLDWSDKTVLILTDPLGFCSEETSRLLGVNTTLNFQPLVMGSIARSSGALGETEVMFQDRLRRKPVWGLQIKITW
jgi:hypothetical protein